MKRKNKVKESAVENIGRQGKQREQKHWEQKVAEQKQREQKVPEQKQPDRETETEERKTGKRPAGKKPAGKKEAGKIPACYILWAVLAIFFTGLISLCLSMNRSIPEETGKNTVEILSSLLGSIYISFLLGRWKEKEWTKRRTQGEIKTSLISGMALFTCRTISRLVLSLFPEGEKGAGYFAALMIDLICIILIYSRLPGGRKEEGSHA